jgi:hypothetical protein
MSEHADGNFSAVAHPDSIFMRYIWDKSYRIEKVDGELRLITS